MLWVTENRVLLSATFLRSVRICRVQLSTNAKSERASFFSLIEPISVTISIPFYIVKETLFCDSAELYDKHHPEHKHDRLSPW